MRLIDADKLTKDSDFVTSHVALIKKCRMKHQSGCGATTCEDCFARLFKYYEHLAPTVEAEPVNCGKWDCVNGIENVYMCTACGDELMFESNTPEFWGYVFCPYCGAKMSK